MKNTNDKKSFNNTFDAYMKEYYDTINQLWHDNSHLKEFKYFLDTVYHWCSIENKQFIKPDVVILGTSIPEELVIAAGANPYFIFGGSLSSISWSDEFVPRDTDPVSRSVLGYIHQPNGPNFSDSLFIIPLTNDSMRKIAYELQAEGRKICTIDIPPDRCDIHAEKKWQMQMLIMTEAIEKHMGTHVTKRSLKSAVESVSKARRTLLNFLDATRSQTDIITSAARQLVQNSYYFTNSLNDWTQHLETLTTEAAYISEAFANKEQDRPGVLLLGSPVIFPNYKVPFLMHDIGLDILDSADSALLKTHIVYDRKSIRGSCAKIICNIASQWRIYDASPAFIKNDVLYNYVSWLIRKGDIEGVVYHVLKGQIEYDFELERFETLMSKYNIPVFRLETDYQYQDVEQLRIRMEAFSEMLVQRKYKINRKVQSCAKETVRKEERAAS